MHTISCDAEKNRLLITLEGFISKDEAQQVAEEIAQQVINLSRDFDVISDLTKFKFGSVGGAASLNHAMEILQMRGARKVVRIAGPSRAGLTQFLRITAAHGAYKPIIVATREQAEAELNKP